MSSKTVLVAGGSGMIGMALTEFLVAGDYKVIVLSRDPSKAKSKQSFDGKVSFAQWDVKQQTIDPAAIAAADIIIHLAGAGIVDKPWTDAYKKVLVESRTKSSELLIKGIKETPNRVKR